MKFFRTAATAAAVLSVAVASWLPLSAAGAATTPAPSTVSSGSTATAAQLAAWQTSIGSTPTPSTGCFTASYPRATWQTVACASATVPAYAPGRPEAGNGKDYAASVPGRIASATGSFTRVAGVRSEKDGSKANTYSLQLNAQFYKSAVCNGATTPSSCRGWQQFIYSNAGYTFMQYWLINYGSRCPSGGWMAFQGSCYRNSAIGRIPRQALGQLHSLTVRGAANAGGNDTVTTTTATKAYAVTGKDSVVQLGKSWQQAEYNVVGDGNGSGATFNSGSSITVKIALKTGKTAAPACASNAGTTAETNNLTLGSCSHAGGSSPSVSFTEKN